MYVSVPCEADDGGEGVIPVVCDGGEGVIPVFCDEGEGVIPVVCDEGEGVIPVVCDGGEGVIPVVCDGGETVGAILTEYYDVHKRYNHVISMSCLSLSQLASNNNCCLWVWLIEVNLGISKKKSHSKNSHL